MFQEEIAYLTVRMEVLKSVNISRKLILKELDLGKEQKI